MQVKNVKLLTRYVVPVILSEAEGSQNFVTVFLSYPEILRQAQDELC